MLNNSYQPASSIAWISLPRTGTNYLCELLHHHHKIESHYEIFHKHKFYGRDRNKIINYLNNKYSTTFSNYQDPMLIKWIHEKPQELLLVLKELSPNQYFSFKVFPGQLDFDLIKETILNDRSVKKILVKRNLVDVYISRQNAMKLEKWGHINTSEMKLEINFDEFLRWFNWVNQWYKLFEEGLSSSGQAYSVLTYRGLHSHQTEKDKFIYLINFLRTVGINLELQQVAANLKNSVVYKKQDTRASISEKIANYPEFKAQMSNQGLERLLVA
jgi:Sulfotransferase domain